MNKTIRANIGGRVFNLEEEAYEKLSKYLDSIKMQLQGQESIDEIMADIELRIAELFIDRTSPAKEVIDSRDVSEIIAIMGDPKDYKLDDEEGKQASGSQSYWQRSEKRVFRDPDNKVLFGVCSGLSAYLGWDPIILRLLFALVFIFYGTGLLLYILLAIIIPKAKTTAEKLQMRGEPVTVENISRKVSESFKEMKDDIADFGKKKDLNEDSLKRLIARVADVLKKLGNLLYHILQLLANVISRLLGAILIFIGVVLMAAILGSLLGWETTVLVKNNGIIESLDIPWLVHSLFAEPWQSELFLLSIGAVFFIPSFGLFVSGTRLLFRHHIAGSYLGSVLVALWFISFGLGVFCLWQLAGEFREESKEQEKHLIHLPGDEVLQVDIIDDGAIKYLERMRDQENLPFLKIPLLSTASAKAESTALLPIVLRTSLPNRDTSYVIEIHRSAAGRDLLSAEQNLDKIKLRIDTLGNKALISPVLRLPANSKLRAQEASYIVKIPLGKRIHFSEQMAPLLGDIRTVNRLKAEEIAGQQFIMTRNGLLCESCTKQGASLLDTSSHMDQNYEP